MPARYRRRSVPRIADNTVRIAGTNLFAGARLTSRSRTVTITVTGRNYELVDLDSAVVASGSRAQPAASTSTPTATVTPRRRLPSTGWSAP